MMTGSIENEQPSLDDLISLSEAAEISGLSSGHLRLLVSKGEIMGEKIGSQLVYY